MNMDSQRDADSGSPPAARRAVLLQGPVGPFFSRLQNTLDRAGWATIRVLFNLGDRYFHQADKSIAFRETMDRWPDWFADFIKTYKPDVIFLFGDQREIHRHAIVEAQRVGVKVLCFEEGYLRPDYVTMELGGNNACSSLRFIDLSGPPPVSPAPLKMPGNAFSQMALNAAFYFTIMRLGTLRYPHYRHHRRRGTVRESLMWVRNAALKWKNFKRNLRSIHKVIDVLDQKYFLVALQVHDDLQLIRHGAGWTQERLISSAIASFSRSAHPDHHLVFKGHPMDRGHSSTRQMTQQFAKIFNVASRVHYVDDGSLGLLSRHSRGMVTINSTSAIVAFGHRKPVFACGDNFYEQMTVNGSNHDEEALAHFWRLTPQVDKTRWEAFRAQIVATSQINGSFYLDSEIDATCRRVIERVEGLLTRTPRAGGVLLRFESPKSDAVEAPRPDDV